MQFVVLYRPSWEFITDFVAPSDEILIKADFIVPPSKDYNHQGLCFINFTNTENQLYLPLSTSD